MVVVNPYESINYMRYSSLVYYHIMLPTWNEGGIHKDSLVAHRKQTSSSGNQILFQAWHIKGKEGSEWGVKNVI